jgi:hypothetical protein
MAGFVFAETQAMHSSAAITASLAEETVTAAAQGQAAGMSVIPPGLDATSAQNAAAIHAYTSEVASQLHAGAGLQVNYGQAVAGSAQNYVLADSAGAADISTVTSLTT